ncbi:hypothetical protein NCU00229 [Neurospora crassa OR74A]|uniref:Uncharacterized protein n=1 Tax=Neurospora crassa (strain ATCC 24698 / 74-OR23-1A / CBS 708.71 / DSM 1257 / FGSC 987) TaxID=367110 RepID=Q7RZY2_NEUCR|nr:hypothetical protein NCU00229 [Neurospora crassa OR74A]EAA28464.2 hypothetical protein NCU00229 [Neurospora crassa OR74A]|eukprot:XP_957700.2 hypothetical protein NCU00229 [Neurospora crassa OR74A]
MIKLLHRTWPRCQQTTTVLTKRTKTNRIPMYAWVADSPESRGCSFFTTMMKKRATKIKTKKTGVKSKTTGRGTTFPIPGRTTRDRRGQKWWSMFNNSTIIQRYLSRSWTVPHPRAVASMLVWVVSKPNNIRVLHAPRRNSLTTSSTYL